MVHRSISLTIITALALFLGACALQQQEISEFPASPPNPAEKSSTAAVNPQQTEQVSNACNDPFDGTVPAFRTEGWETNFCLRSVDYAEIIPGGPPRDGIPPIDNPRFEDVDSADEWIDDPEPVILVELNETTRAYPLQIMIWHEIVNDTISGDPVAVTFCPLCNTALVFRRPVVDGEVLTFGTSGNLRNSDLVMWDRQTESWWQQFTGEAIIGDLTGTRLEALPAAIISWKDFKDNNPDGEVLSIETGFNRSYGRNPYAGYDDINSHPFLFIGDPDGALPPMARVVGLILEDGTGGAFSLDLLQENQVLNEGVGENPVVLFWKAGTASALDSGSISNGRDVGATGVFDPVIDQEILTFTPLGEGIFQDQQTGSTWNIFGRALDGPLAGTQLTPLPHHDTFWFAWAAFVPEGSLNQ